ncbi:RNA polymerase sigma-70 factor, ECF subfamily [Mariniphaga anaerophila]|uniref:RNA polymerase sigma factor n=1 Tax=Mariniphaga anaerophila TaxID=1484053 RepID=A0A1M4ZTA5_9BACT|nr:RNA polymerase sigma-70 factor [Mariniphaga anaerophila]SHF20816.1 RNA polymerase sigma-70 factor, ECF subfamily [Mariniphaga anaerophila]
MNKGENEILLITALKKGDTEAFNKLFFLYGSRIYHFTFGYLKSKEESEEVVQEVFLRIWKNRKSLNSDLSFQAYLFKIAYHIILVHFERASRHRAYKDKLIEESIKFSADNEERLNYQLLLEKVERLIEELPPRQKDVLVKRRKEGLSLKEIAVLLDIAPKTVENHLTEALKTIRRQLGEDNISAMLFFLMFVKC